MEASEIKLWRAVICKAALDASANLDVIINEQRGAKWHYTWAKSNKCKLVCEYANLEYSIVLNAFKRIYLDSLEGKNKSTRHLLIKQKPLKKSELERIESLIFDTFIN
jgi:hypothetical protein